jgi:hypothetical protein
MLNLPLLPHRPGRATGKAHSSGCPRGFDSLSPSVELGKSLRRPRGKEPPHGPAPSFRTRRGSGFEHASITSAIRCSRPPWSRGRRRIGGIPCVFVTKLPRPPRRILSTTAAPSSPASNARGPVIFAELPKTATGKIRKHVLRERARALSSRSPRVESPFHAYARGLTTACLPLQVCEQQARGYVVDA